MNNKPKMCVECLELVEVGRAVGDLARALLQEINNKNIKLFDLPAHKRIFLFILTRAIKTFTAIEVLCLQGFGQDVAALIRSLLENLITAQYIIFDEKTADHMAKRFVEYKWVIFKRSLAEEERGLRRSADEEKVEFNEKKELILKHVEEFKKRYDIKSDRALITWSGKTVKDMARQVSKELYDEYESTFRRCSRFSHPTILGDKEYIVQDQRSLTFSPRPSAVGVDMNYQAGIRYFMAYLDLVNNLFKLQFAEDLSALRKKFQDVQDLLNKKNSAVSPREESRATNIREVNIYFDY